MSVNPPVSIVKYVDANGRLTHEGMIFFQKMVAEVQALQKRVTALEAFH